MSTRSPTSLDGLPAPHRNGREDGAEDEKQNSRTVTSAVRGVFADCAMTREEFLRLALG